MIEEYTTIVNPQKISGAVSCYFELEVEPAQFSAVVDTPARQRYRDPDLPGVRPQQAPRPRRGGWPGELRLLDRVIHRLPGVASLSCNIILSRIKDIKGLRL